MLVEQLQDVVDDCVLGFGEQVRLREGGFGNAGTGILAAKLGEVSRNGPAWCRDTSVQTLLQPRRSPTYGVDGIQGIQGIQADTDCSD